MVVVIILKAIIFCQCFCGFTQWITGLNVENIISAVRGLSIETKQKT